MLSNSSPLAAPAKKPKREFLMDAVLDGDGDFEMRSVSPLKKRRRTIGSRDD